eukprot:SM000054S18040  [mRNA]  locus=s54:13199:13816:- [translate_table: standard]
MRIAECVVGDATGAVVFTARNDQVDVAKEGATLALRNAKVDTYKGAMRLAVDNRWGRVEAASPSAQLAGEPRLDNNLSLLEYELVYVADGARPAAAAAIASSGAPPAAMQAPPPPLAVPAAVGLPPAAAEPQAEAEQQPPLLEAEVPS